MLGYVFKPVSFWYCERADGSLAAIVVEVNNTFGERHCYLLAGEQLAYGHDLQRAKVFHVSPFCHIVGGYRFRFMRSPRPTASAASPASTMTTPTARCCRPACRGRLAPLTPASARARILRPAADDASA